ncbi:beta strand repeat-containing protein [Bartonella schoenbuchensis]|uniref:beta strand repeat-containing protein n=1 Tax=Bartonella schoenbuchensis TaxID=165694 RepID=UPI003145588B
MVMRRVFNHHVCLCVLSTAILAGLALMTSQTKVYAQAQNCKGVVNGDGDGQGDDKGGLIMCDGESGGTGGPGGVLDGDRDIDMNMYSGETAVTITGASTKITIKSELTVWDSRGTGNNTTAIKVGGQGKLTVMNANVTGVKKGIVVSDSGSSVTVVQGSIGVGMGMGPVIEVSNNGRVVLNDGVTVTGSGSSTGEVVIENGGDVTLMGTRFDNVTTGIVVKGNGNASVKGGATITVKQGGTGGTGFKMQGQANASATVVDMTINGSGGKGIGAEVSSGTLTMNRVQLKQLETGAKVTGSGVLKLEGGTTIDVAAGGKGLEVLSGTANVANTTITLQGDGSKGLVMSNGVLKLNGDSTINVKQGGTGVEVSNGTANVMGATITLQGNRGKGLVMSGGKVTMMGGSITGSGNGMGTTGVEMKGSADVTLTRVEIKEVKTGVVMGSTGTLEILGKSKINVKQGGTGLEVLSGTVMMTEGEITAGGTGTGLSMTGDANVTLTRVTMKDVKTGVEMTGSGTFTVEGGSITGSGTGINVIMGGDVTVKGGTRITGFATGVEMRAGKSLTVKEGTTIQFTGGYGIKVGAGMTEATLTNVTITGSGGGTGVDVKGNADVTLTRVTMQDVKTGVEVQGNGTFTVEGGSITGSGSGTGINATDGNVTVKGGARIEGFTTEINMKGTGTLTVEKGTTINFMGAYGVYVGDRVKNTTLTDVTITGSGSGYGVKVEGGAVVMNTVGITLQGSGTAVLMEEKVTNASLTGVTIRGVRTGITMMGSGEFTVSGTTTINFTGEYGVMVGTSVASTTLTGTVISGEGNGKGVWVKGGMVTMNTVNVSNVGTGVYAGGGALTVSGGSIGFTGTYGVMVEKGVTSATLTGVMITGNKSGTGIYAEGGSLTVSGGEIKGVKMGIKMEGNGTLTVKDRTTINFTGDDGYGVYVGTSVKKAELTKVEIKGSGENGYGVYTVGEKVMMKQVEISNVGMGVEMSDGVMWLKETHLRDVVKGMTIEEAVVVMEKGSVEFKGDYGIDLTRGYAFLGGVEIKGKETEQEGIRVNEGMLDLYKTNVRDVYKGMTVKEGSVVRMFEGEITFKGEHGILLGQGGVALMGVRMTYKGDNKVKGANGADVVSPNFIKVEGGTVAVENITMTGNGGKGQGVKVAKGGVVWLKKTTFTNVRSGMTVGRGGVMRMEGGSITFNGGHG